MPQRALTLIDDEDEASTAMSGPDDRQTPFDVALVPLLLGLGGCFWFNPAASGTSAANALGALALGALGALAFARDPFVADRYTRIGVGLIALLALYYIVLRSGAVSPGGTMLEGARMATCALVIWAARSALTRASSRWLLLTAVGAAAVWASAPTVLDTIRNGGPSERVAGELGYWNASAIIALVLVPLAAALARSPRHLMLPLSGVLVTVAATVATATASRGALGALALGMLVLLLASSDRRRWLGVAAVAGGGVLLGIGLLAWDPIPAWACLMLTAVGTSIGFGVAASRAGSVDRDTRAPRARRMSVLGVLICVAAVGMIGTLLLNFATERIEIPSSNDNVSRLATANDSERIEWWSETLDRWSDGRILGQGGQAFEVSRAMQAMDPVAHPHSLILQVLIETGILGLVVAMAAALFVLRATLGAPRSPERAVASAIAVMIIAQATIDWTWSIPQVMAVGVIAIAILLPGRSKADHPVSEPLGRASVTMSLATLGVVASLTIVAVVPVLAGILADQAARGFDEKRPRAAARSAHQSMTLVPAYSTLQIEVLALEAAGDARGARRTLEEQERVWWPLPAGLQFALQRYPSKSKEYARIERQIGLRGSDI